ncbi:MAG: hypothetical protein KKA07_05830 [Bacteroidetes bacterium]|nr:hypothetical protein [Bacteroidota bacterium]MBU1718574.1 hypothetical protein [Bacteroidota bacterium]
MQNYSEYKETQIGWLVLIPFAAILFFLPIAWYYQWGDHPIDSTMLIVLEAMFLFMLFLFVYMKTYVNEQEIKLVYGIGIFVKKIPISDIRSVVPVRTKWYYGAGIKKIPNGMLYSIHGLNAVELTFKSSSKVVRVGTKDSSSLVNEVNIRLPK